jgi:hypothetical protein
MLDERRAAKAKFLEKIEKFGLTLQARIEQQFNEAAKKIAEEESKKSESRA